MSCRSLYRKEPEKLGFIGLISGRKMAQKSRSKRAVSLDGSAISPDPREDPDQVNAAEILMALRRSGDRSVSNSNSTEEKEEEDIKADSGVEIDNESEDGGSTKKVKQQRNRRKGKAIEEEGGPKWVPIRPATTGDNALLIYKPEEEAFIIKHARRMSGLELTAKFNQRFNQDKSSSAIRTKASRLEKKVRA